MQAGLRLLRRGIRACPATCVPEHASQLLGSSVPLDPCVANSGLQVYTRCILHQRADYMQNMFISKRLPTFLLAALPATSESRACRPATWHPYLGFGSGTSPKHSDTTGCEGQGAWSLQTAHTTRVSSPAPAHACTNLSRSVHCFPTFSPQLSTFSRQMQCMGQRSDPQGMLLETHCSVMRRRDKVQALPPCTALWGVLASQGAVPCFAPLWVTNPPAPEARVWGRCIGSSPEHCWA